MAIWCRRTHVTTREEWALPYINGSTNTAALTETMNAARKACAEARGCKVSELPDNAVNVTADSDTLIVFFETRDSRIGGE